MEALARKTTKSRDRIILRAVETYMLYEGADIYDAITARERAAVGRVAGLRISSHNWTRWLFA